MRVVPVLTRSMETVSPPSEMARELYEICARPAREIAGLRMSLKNSTVGNLLAVMRIGEPCGGEVNGTMIQGIGWRMPDHQLLIQLRKAIASLD